MRSPVIDRFSGKVAIVTGATSGIGEATARALANEGASVVLAGRRSSPGEEITAELRAQGLVATFVRTDVRDPDSVANMVDTTVKLYGRLDLAVNNAGVGGPNLPVAQYPIDEWDEVLTVNLKGVWLCMKHEIPQLLRGGGGAIVNMASDMGLVGAPFGIAPYVASKHGVVGLTRAAALEYASQSIRINAVCPGLTETDMLNPAKRNPQFLARHIESHIPMKRVAGADEQARAILWLCSSDSSFVTGIALPVDGGILAK
jgi:NAD(P)-dependent dehydrogenase (short-subunit alcohol dehydrogenase family)